MILAIKASGADNKRKEQIAAIDVAFILPIHAEMMSLPSDGSFEAEAARWLMLKTHGGFNVIFPLAWQGVAFEGWMNLWQRRI